MCLEYTYRRVEVCRKVSRRHFTPLVYKEESRNAYIRLGQRIRIP